MNTASDIYRQSGVLPYRIQNKTVQILLITTSSRKHWTIPKGIVEDGLSAVESAMQEAFEEAGIDGRLHQPAIGQFQYEKWGGVCSVEVFLLEVTSVAEAWPEAEFRQRQWVGIEKARQMVKHEGLRGLFGHIYQRIVSLPPAPS